MTAEPKVTRRPSAAEIEAHFGDQGGARPVVAELDAAPGEICGNGRSYYHLTRPAKPLPEGWRPPPLPGTDLSYLGPEPTAPFKESPYALAAQREVRLRKPIIERWDRAFRDELAVRLAEISGPLAVTDGRDAAAFAGLEDRLLPCQPALLETADERAAAEALLARGASLLLVDRTLPRVSPWVEERMHTLRLRLRDAGNLSWFHPVALSSGWALYRIAPPLRITDDDRRCLTALARAVLGGKTPARWSLDLPLAPVGLPVHRAVVSLRMRGEATVAGRKLAKRMAKGEDLPRVIERAARRLGEDWPKIRAAVAKDYGATLPEALADALPCLEIEIDVLHDVCLLADHAPEALLWQIQPGLEGIMLHDEVEGVTHYLEPSHAVHNAISTPIVFFEAMLKKARLHQFLRPARTEHHRRTRGEVLSEAVWQKDTRFRFMRFRTLNWIEEPGGGAVVPLYRGVPLKRPADVTRAALVRALELGAGWLMRHQQADGQYRYAYRPTNPPKTRWAAGGNIVRHALNPYTLLLVHAVAPDPALVDSARRGIEHTLEFVRWKGERCVICHRDPPAPYHNAKLGSNAVTILSLLKLAEVEGIGPYEPALRGLAEEILFMQDPNGHFRQYDVPSDHPYYGAENTIVPGEAIIALARLHKWSGDARYKAAIDKALPFYMTAWRAWRDARSPEGVWDEERRVNLVGIVPWLVMALKDLHDSSGDDAYAALAFELQDWLETAFFYTPERSRWPDWLGASFKAHVEPPAINSCQYIEGAAAAFALGKRLGNDVDRRRRTLLLGARFCLQLQYDGYGSTFFLPEPDSALGGFRYTLAHLHLRNDYSYHAMNALAQAVEYLDPEDYAVAEGWG